MPNDMTTSTFVGVTDARGRVSRFSPETETYHVVHDVELVHDVPAHQVAYHCSKIRVLDEQIGEGVSLPAQHGTLRLCLNRHLKSCSLLQINI